MSNNSISHRLHEQLERIIEATEPGGRLPSEPALAQQLGVSRATLREAMRTFETQGRIRRRQGSGTFVTHTQHVIESGLEVLESIETLAQRIGLPVTVGALKVERRSASEQERHARDWTPGQHITMDQYKALGEEVLSISRAILAEGRPVAYLVDMLPADILPADDLGAEFSGSVLDLLLRKGEPPLSVSRTEVNAVTASPKVARAMGIQRGDVLLCFVADLYTSDGRVIDHSLSYFLPGYFRFHILRRVG
ncbi:MAG: GntR family transcriptional regulator [Anaerolineales bacterium]|nr:GntR family transcriptional regulator [Anaerolineales bacterium]